MGDINGVAEGAVWIVYVALAVGGWISAKACRSVWKHEGWELGVLATALIVALWGYLLYG